MTNPSLTPLPNGHRAVLSACIHFELLLAIVILLISTVRKIAFPLELNLNCAVYLQAAKCILAGGQAFVDFWDTNPPLIFFLNLPPALLSDRLNVPIEIAFTACVALLALWSVVSCFFVLKAANEGAQFQFIGGLLAYALVTAVTGVDFGEREHLFILTFVPFLLLRSVRWNETQFKFNTSLAILLGVAAGVGSALKPFFLICIFLPEVAWLFSNRKHHQLFTGEIVGFGAGLLLSSLSVLLLPSEAKSNFFEVVQLLSKGYSAANCSLYTVITFENNRQLGLLAIFAAACAYSIRKHSYFLPPLSFVLLATYCCYVVQQKGWTYHAIPLCTVVFMIVSISAFVIGRLAFIGSRLAQEAEIQNLQPLDQLNLKYLSCVERTFRILLVLSFCALMYCTVKTIQSWRKEPSLRPVGTLASLISTHSSQGDYIAVLSSTNAGYPFITQSQRLTASRYSSLFWVQALQKIRADKSMDAAVVDELEGRFATTVMEDCAKYKPKLIFIRKRNDYCPQSFSLSEFLNRYGLARVLSLYRPLKSTEDFDVYQRL